MPAVIAGARRLARIRMPAVGHHRRRTRLNERRSASMPRTFSISSAGTATDHAQEHHTPETLQAANPNSSGTPWISVSHSSEPNRLKPNRSDWRQSVSVPRYVSLTAFRHAAWARALEAMLITRMRSSAARPAHSPSDAVVVVPTVVEVPGSDCVISTLRTWTGRLTYGSDLYLVTTF